MWKWITALIVVFVILGGCVGGGIWAAKSGKLKDLQEQFNPGMKPLEVRLEKPRRGDLIRTISAPGSIDPRTKVDISAQVSARIVALLSREGQRVKKGDVLVRLDADDLVAALDSSKAQLASEQARLVGVRAAMENTEREMRRMKELLDTNDVSLSEFEAMKTNYEQAKSSYEQTLNQIDIAKANIKRAEKDLGNTTIQASIDGIVTHLDAEVGELVVVGTLNNPGSVIMQLADLSDMLMKAKVDEANIAPVTGGQRCRVFINAYPGKEFVGEVERVRPTKQLDKDGTTYFETEIRVELPKDNGLRGMLSNVDIEVETLRDVIKVPTQAILDRAVEDLPASIRNNPIVDKNKKFARVVFVVKDGKAVPLPVTVGSSDLTDTVVLAGLTGDETIIVGPYRSLIGLKADQAVREKIDEPVGETGGKPPAKPEEKPGEERGGADARTPSGGPP
ncbi:MAG: efflux RND transporter periplasmic adaptor subunit [Tepidisphaera sp.]